MVQLMVFKQVILFTLAIMISGETELEKQCNSLPGIQHKYMWNSCLTLGSLDCSDFPNGHWLVLPTAQMIQQFFDVLTMWGATAGYKYEINLKQVNQSNEPSGNWQWHHNGRVFDIPSDMNIWAPNEPNNEYSGNTAQYGMFHYGAGGIVDLHVTAVMNKMCQYSDVRATKQFHRTHPGHKAHEAGRIEQHNTKSAISCAKYCSDDPICHSFSYKEVDGDCLLNWDDGKYVNYLPIIAAEYDMYILMI